jgi:glycosyltransferase involved in cell wall biosynthesis
MSHGEPRLRGEVARLAVLSSHPIQYYGPLFRELAKTVDLQVFFAHQPSAEEQGRAGFGTAFTWDVEITAGYRHEFLDNVARRPGVDHFLGCDTPAVGERLAAGDFDAVMLTGWGLKSFLQGAVAAKRLGLPVLVRGDSQLLTPRSGLKAVTKELVYPAFLRLFDSALYVGQRAAAYYRHYRFPEDRLYFSPHCVDTDWFASRATGEARSRLRKQLGVSPATALVLFAGKLVPFKRPTDVVEAVAAARRDGLDVEVLVAGDGQLRADLIARAQATETPLHLLGFCNQTAMPEAYAAADCLVLPSDGNETWGLVANEALACGRPVIVSEACGCAPDLARGGEAGRSCAVGDIPAFAAAIRAVVDGPPALKLMQDLSNQYSLRAAAEGVITALYAGGRPQRDRVHAKKATASR